MSRSEGESLSSSLSFDSVSVCVLPSPPSDCSLSVYGMGTATFLGTKAKGATGASSGTQSLTGQSFRVLCITKNKEQNTKLPRRSVGCFRVCSCPSRSRARAAGGGAGSLYLCWSARQVCPHSRDFRAEQFISRRPLECIPPGWEVLPFCTPNAGVSPSLSSKAFWSLVHLDRRLPRRYGVVLDLSPHLVGPVSSTPPLSSKGSAFPSSPSCPLLLACFLASVPLYWHHAAS